MKKVLKAFFAIVSSVLLFSCLEKSGKDRYYMEKVRLYTGEKSGYNEREKLEQNSWNRRENA